MSETNHFITHFEVSNFKKFDHLVVDDIGQFNLITGDNNVGKTCLLEALMVDKEPNRTFFFYSVLRKKRNFNDIRINSNVTDSEKIYKENFISKYQKLISEPIIFHINNQTIRIENQFGRLFNSDEKGVKIFLNNEIEHFLNKTNFFGNNKINQNSSNWLKFYLNNELIFLKDLTNDENVEFENNFNSDLSLPIVFFSDNLSEEFYWTYSKLFNINIDIKFNIINILNLIFKELMIIDIIYDSPLEKTINSNSNKEINFKIATEVNRNFHNLNNYGDGFIRIFQVLLLIYSGFQHIYIDEIEIGIHFSKMKVFWKNILKLCKELNIQLFATTHSQECIEAYAQALEELELEEEGRLITLKEDNQQIFANSKRFDAIKYGIENGYNGLG